MNNLGYSKPLFILPFDHRGSFVKGLIGKEESLLTSDDRNYIISQKKIIYNAFKKAIQKKIIKDNAAILIDEEFGDEIIKDANLNGINVILTTEKSGEQEFTFQYPNFEEHIEKYKPAFAKVLIRYNPDQEIASKKRQQKELKRLSDYCHKSGHKFFLEPLIPATVDQLTKAGGNQDEYIKSQRPFLAARAIGELQEAGVEPDVWKLEGTTKKEGYEKIVEAAIRDGRDNVGVVILGGGKEQELVEEWIKIAAKIKGIIGFAVGRTVFWQPLMDLKEGKINQEEAVSRIANNFIHFYDLFISNN
ncbi:DUF2090 domain-containing protein [Patescibacteria group bacterium]|nr:DUF2090 domain-containing protein [Patescibacteria group bacterium]